ncbi:MAG: AarF/ABC1/UbiB kinase family protein, partial [Planctomycetaceae bacterium]|nr:AarF/ABC1/UbiB kinase family protein [Planctomycetaceae bacterium]
GQVHRAVLKEGQQSVAVKVQRPDVELVYQRDIRVVGFIISIIEYLRIRPYARWRHMLWEVEEAMREELDYRYEASNMRRLKRNLKSHGVYCPIVFDTWSTRRILVMEFVTGVLMADYLNIARTDPARLEQWHEANNVAPRVVARRLLHSFLRQTFEDNLFHSDLHPGNIVLLRDSRIAFLDFGSAGTMERDFRRKADMFLEALGTRQYSKAIDLFFLFSDGLPPHNLEECKAHMVRRLLAWDTRSRVEQLPFEAKTLNRMMDELVLIAAQYRIAPVWSFFRMTRAMATMDASLQELDPHADFHDLIIDYHKRRAVRSRDRLLHDATHRQPNFRELMDVQQTLLDESVYRGTIVRRTAQVFESAASSATRAAANMMKLTAILLWGLFGLGILAWLYQVGWLWGAGSNSWLNTWIGGDWGWQAWVILLGLVNYLARRLWQLARKFRED